MRGEIEGPGSLRRIIIAAFLFFFYCFTDAQTLPDRVVEIIERMAEEGVSEEEMVRYYENLALRRPSINAQSRRQLESCGLFSVFQVESILDYRKQYGDILSEGELSLVDGFNAAAASCCAIFFSFTSDSQIAAPYEEPRLKQTLTAKAKSDYGASGTGVTLKYSASYGKSYSAGFTLDNDAGEALRRGWMPDFCSGYLCFDGAGPLRKLVIGDYTVRSGQGLALWKAFGMSVFGAPASVARNPRGVLPYTSNDEADFFRGAAATLRAGRGDVTLFASANRLDARIVGDTAYTSIVTGGYHCSATELAKRRTMREYVAGGCWNAEYHRLRCGVTALAYRYDKHNGRTVKDYNRYQIYDGWWGDVSADFYCFLHDFRLFGEVAVDAGGSPAAVAGAVWSPGYNLETSVLGRLYSRSYIATHSGAYSSLSSCSNQRGLTCSAKWIFATRWTLSGNAEYSYYPWSRYGIAGPSAALKYRLALGYAEDGGSSADIQVAGNPAPRWRANCVWAVNGKWRLNLRYAGNPGGHGGFAECAYSPSSRLKVSARLTCCNTKDWDSRLYFYEGGVPQSFSVTSYYGKRAGAYLYVKYTPVRNLDLWLKASDRNYAFFMRIFIPG